MEGLLTYILHPCFLIMPGNFPNSFNFVAKHPSNPTINIFIDYHLILLHYHSLTQFSTHCIPFILFISHVNYGNHEHIK